MNLFQPIYQARRLCLGLLFAVWLGPAMGVLRADEPAEWIWHDRWVTSLAPGSDGILYASLATGMPHREGSVVKFSNMNPDDAKELYKQPAAVWAIATSPDKSTVASTDFQGSLAVTPTAGGETKHYEKVFAKWTRAIAFAADSKQLAAGNEAGTVFAWSIGEGKSTASRDLASGQIMSMAFSSSGDTLAVATGSGKLQLIKWPSLEAIK
ncbi:MAG TPA: WD40 repeat domain-containing protein, partial [Pirellula sp.]|nr:WD40 repeat domain-containing protein [Pirellula sp.]